MPIFSFQFNLNQHKQQIWHFKKMHIHISHYSSFFPCHCIYCHSKKNCWAYIKIFTAILLSMKIHSWVIHCQIDCWKLNSWKAFFSGSSSILLAICILKCLTNNSLNLALLHPIKFHYKVLFTHHKQPI